MSRGSGCSWSVEPTITTPQTLPSTMIGVPADERMPNSSPVTPSGPDASETNVSMGVQLRHARLVKGLRLKDVADLSNCSESMISKIENNKTAPSLNTLHRIAKALGTSVATLLQDRSANGKVVIRKNERQVIPAADLGRPDPCGRGSEPR